MIPEEQPFAFDDAPWCAPMTPEERVTLLMGAALAVVLFLFVFTAGCLWFFQDAPVPDDPSLPSAVVHVSDVLHLSGPRVLVCAAPVFLHPAFIKVLK